MDLLNYRKRINLKVLASNGIHIQTDMGDEYQASAFSGNISKWSENQYQSDLRIWQKDICLGYLSNSFQTKPNTYLIYKKGQGFNQYHDMLLAVYPAKSNRNSIVVFSTYKDLWIQPFGKDITLDVSDTLGSIDDEKNRKENIYPLLKTMRQEFNPEYKSYSY